MGTFEKDTNPACRQGYAHNFTNFFHKFVGIKSVVLALGKYVKHGRMTDSLMQLVN